MQGNLSISSEYFELATARMNWARVGIDRLKSQIDNFIATKPCEIVPSIERQGDYAYFSFTLSIHTQPSPEIRFAVGDVIHNLCATLDNLIWGLGQTLRAPNDVGLEFYGTQANFDQKYSTKLSQFPQPVYDWIESIQPYHQTKYIKSLYALHRLWSLDKHRAPDIVRTAGKPMTSAKMVRPHSAEQITFCRVSHETDGQIITTAIVRWDRKDEFEIDFFPIVAFTENGPVGLDPLKNPTEVVSYLQAVQDHISGSVLPKFKPYFK